MAEFDMILTESPLLELEYVPKNEKILIFDVYSIQATRVPKVYTERFILPAFYREEDTEGNDIDMKRETREFTMVLPFSSGNQTPRHSPNEIIYHGKKTKNKFTID